jgi:hypothetical protein
MSHRFPQAPFSFSLDLMRHSLFVALLAILASAAPADIKPADPSKPLFRILRFKTLHEAAREEENAKGEVDDEHPMLVVWKLRDVQLARDNKGVRMTLTPEDTRKFAAITSSYGYLVFEGDDRPLEVLHITAPITDGIIGFKHPQEAAVAEYLRRRLRIGEFK